MRRSAWINGGIAIAGLALGLMLSMRPWHVYKEQKLETNRHVAEMRAAEKDRADLLREEAHIQSAMGKEEMARKLGYASPNEKPAENP